MARHSTLNVSLTPTLQKYVRSKVSKGGYESASEVIRESLRALQQRDQAEAGFWAGVREKVQDARRQISASRTLDGERAMEQIMRGLEGSAINSKPSKGRGK
jgi:antitoxin ParD1/3/4